jgi:hypothetical protein
MLPLPCTDPTRPVPPCSASGFRTELGTLACLVRVQGGTRDPLTRGVVRLAFPAPFKRRLGAIAVH